MTNGMMFLLIAISIVCVLIVILMIDSHFVKMRQMLRDLPKYMIRDDKLLPTRFIWYLRTLRIEVITQGDQCTINLIDCVRGRTQYVTTSIEGCDVAIDAIRQRIQSVYDHHTINRPKTINHRRVIPLLTPKGTNQDGTIRQRLAVDKPHL